MPLLYCVNGKVVAWYDSDQGVPAEEYGPDATIIPWPNIRTLQKIGPQPKGYDNRPYAAPILQGQGQLIPYAKFKQQRLAGGGVSIDFGSKANPRILNIATDTPSLTYLQSLYLHAMSDKANDTYHVSGIDHVLFSFNAQVISVVHAINAFIAQTNTTLSGVINGINQGFVENQVMVDKPPKPLAPWPATRLRP